MIPVSLLECQDTTPATPSWQTLLQQAVRDPAQLCQRLGLNTVDSEHLVAVCQQFPLRVPEPYLSRIRPGDPHDPLLLQVLPQVAELQDHPGFGPDPLAERTCNPMPGLVHKYGSRVLLVATSLCAIHCRYCFRREFPYEENRNSREAWHSALDYISRDQAINEVILSGGDPLALPDRQLAWLAGEIAAIPHVRRLRLHTRLPIAIPQRITGGDLGWLTGSRLQPIVVLHTNHPNEVDDAVSAAILQLKQAGVTVLNQSVLLAGINDQAAVLAALSERLFAAGCLPYYLHTLDPVRGSHPFALPDDTAVTLHQQLQTVLPGFLVPRLVREIPGRASKTWLG